MTQYCTPENEASREEKKRLSERKRHEMYTQGYNSYMKIVFWGI